MQRSSAGYALFVRRNSPMASESDTYRLIRPAIVLATVVLAVVILSWAKDVFIPLALAILFAFILTPLVAWLRRWGVPRWPAALLVTSCACVVVLGVCWLTAVQLRELLLNLPEHTETIANKLAVFRADDDGLIVRIGGMIHDLSVQLQKTNIVGPVEADQKPIPVVVQNDPGLSLSYFPVVAGPLLQGIVSIILIVILVLFMLVRREDLQYRLIQLVGHGHLTATTHALYEAAQRTSNFLLTQLTINIAFGVVLAGGLAVIGVPYAILWGCFAAVFRFIPYAGTWVALLFPLILSIAVFPDWWQPLTVLAFYIVLELVVANLLEPLLLAHSTGISPIALLVAAAFWTWLWGPIGLVLATPLTVCLAVLGRYMPALSFLHVLLGAEPVLDPAKQFYQRLLAQDPDEAGDIVEETAKKEPLEAIYDKVLIPALVLMRRDQQNGELTEDRVKKGLATIAEIVDDVTALIREEARTSAGGGAVKSEGRPGACVVGFSVGDQFDEIALKMLGALVEAAGYTLTVASASKLPGEVVEQVEQEQPAAVCIASLPPGGLARVRYLCKRLRAKSQDLHILVGRWGQDDLQPAKQRLQAAGANLVADTLLDTRKELIPLMQHFAVCANGALSAKR